MNAKLTVYTIMILTGVLILSLASCANPSGLNIVVQEEPSTGIDTDPETGLIAGLPLEGDAIINNPDVVVSDGVEWVGGLSGNAMRGDEDGDFLRITDGALPELTIAGSVEVWVLPEGANYYTGVLHKGQETDFSDEAWSMQFHADRKPYFYFVGETGTSVSLMAPDQIPLDTWSHLAATWICDETNDTTVIKLYVNGVESVSKEVTSVGPARDSTGDLLIGSQLPEQYNATYGHLTFIGLIDEVSLYDVERTAEEIEAAYQVYFPAP